MYGNWVIIFRISRLCGSGVVVRKSALFLVIQKVSPVLFISIMSPHAKQASNSRTYLNKQLNESITCTSLNVGSIIYRPMLVTTLFSYNFAGCRFFIDGTFGKCLEDA